MTQILRAEPGSRPGTPVFVLNLDRDTNRMDSMLKQLELLNGLRVTRIQAIDGKALPRTALEYLVGNKDWAARKGTIGCFLSHLSAWETISMQAEDYAIVLEDDVVASDLEHLHRYSFPDDADLVFINDRMGPAGSKDRFEILDISATLELLERDRRMGADGYILFKDGARRLVEACTKDLCYGHVDGRLLRYCVQSSSIDDLPASSWIASIIQNHHNPFMMPGLGILRGYCASPPMIKHGSGTSVREMSDML